MCGFTIGRYRQTQLLNWHGEIRRRFFALTRTSVFQSTARRRLRPGMTMHSDGVASHTYGPAKHPDLLRFEGYEDDVLCFWDHQS